MVDEENKNGRPTDYTHELAERICNKIARSEKGLHRLHKIHKSWFPSPTAILKWLDKYPDFALQYSHAREKQADYMAELAVKVASEPLVGERVKVDGTGKKEVTTGDNVERSKLMVHTLQWAASKLAPKKYSERLMTEQNINTNAKYIINGAEANEIISSLDNSLEKNNPTQETP